MHRRNQLLTLILAKIAMSKAVYIYTLFFLFSLQYAYPQLAGHVFAKYNVEHFGESEGLTESFIEDIMLDKDGFLWVGTQSEVKRFNGR